MSGFTSTTLIGLVVGAIDQIDPDLCRGILRPDPMQAGVVPDRDKLTLLSAFVDRHGSVGCPADRAIPGPGRGIARDGRSNPIRRSNSAGRKVDAPGKILSCEPPNPDRHRHAAPVAVSAREQGGPRQRSREPADCGYPFWPSCPYRRERLPTLTRFCGAYCKRDRRDEARLRRAAVLDPLDQRSCGSCGRAHRRRNRK
jgi:hypothetical protein